MRGPKRNFSDHSSTYLEVTDLPVPTITCLMACHGEMCSKLFQLSRYCQSLSSRCWVSMAIFSRKNLSRRRFASSIQAVALWNGGTRCTDAHAHDPTIWRHLGWKLVKKVTATVKRADAEMMLFRRCGLRPFCACMCKFNGHNANRTPRIPHRWLGSETEK